MNLGYDRTCNLACPSCRSGHIALKGKELDTARRLQEKILDGGLKDARRLYITGHGDPFASSLYRELLTDRIDSRKFPDLKIQIITNAQLLTKNMWERMSISRDLVDDIYVSIDAATPETYALNRGGDFNRLLENLRFIGHIRQQSGTLKKFTISFVIQANNFREMDKFVQIGRDANCSRVLFSEIGNWGTYSPEQYKAIAVHEKDHPGHTAFLETFKSQALNDPIVDISNLAKYCD